MYLVMRSFLLLSVFCGSLLLKLEGITSAEGSLARGMRGGKDDITVGGWTTGRGERKGNHNESSVVMLTAPSIVHGIYMRMPQNWARGMGDVASGMRGKY